MKITGFIALVFPLCVLWSLVRTTPWQLPTLNLLL